jgi:transposase
MPNTGLAIELNPGERARLKQWESSHGTPQQVALRCLIILGALAGRGNVAIAGQLGVSRPTVHMWRKRVREEGLDQVWEIALGRGRKPHYDQATLQTKPKGMTHWSYRVMAEAQVNRGGSVSRPLVFFEDFHFS